MNHTPRHPSPNRPLCRPARPLSQAALGLVAAALLVPVAEAGRPLQTEDAGVLDASKCELESGAERASIGPRVTARASYLKLGCGVGVESDISLALEHGREDGQNSYELDLKGKSRIAPLSGESVQVSLLYGTSLARDPEGSTRLGKAGVKGIVSWQLASWNLHADAGWTRDLSKDDDYATWAFAVERTALPSLDLMAEIVDSSVDVAWVNAGFRWRLFEDKFALDAAYGVPTSGEAADLLSVGFKMSL